MFSAAAEEVDFHLKPQSKPSEILQAHMDKETFELIRNQKKF